MSMNIDELKECSVKMINGAPAITVDGEPVPMMSYHWRMGAIDWKFPSEEEKNTHDTKWRIQTIDKAGIGIYFTRMWMNDPKRLDEHYENFLLELKLLTEVNPNAFVIPWININAYDEFATKYPDDVIHFEDGTVNKWNDVRFCGVSSAEKARYSYASEAWKCEVGGMLREFIYRLLRSPYKKNIIGYFLFIYDQESSWFFEFDTDKHAIDFSPAMKNAFRNFLIEKYRGDEKLLQKTWKDEKVTFSNAYIPGLRERTEGDLGYFRDPSKKAAVYDYVECHNAVVADKLIYLGKVCKEASMQKHIVGTFFGYLQHRDMQFGGHTEIKKVMKSPYIDFWSSPLTYENRTAGDFASMRMAIKSLNKNGKMFVAEVDTFLSDSSVESLTWHRQPVESALEDKAVLIRDFTYVFLEGCHGWWNDWSTGLSQYKDDGLLPVMKKMNEISKESFLLPRNSVSDIACVIDQESLHVPACSSVGGSHYLPPAFFLMSRSLDLMRIHELHRLGTPVDYYETDDVISGDGRKYRMYIFLNQYMASDSERNLIEKHLKKDGNILVWLYGAGLINTDSEQALTLENASKLTGIHLNCDMGESRCVMAALNSNVLHDIHDGELLGDCKREIKRTFSHSDGKPVYHDANKVNPLIYVEDNDVIPLATFCVNGKVGMAMKKFDNWSSVYIGSPYIQANVLRNLARYADVHLFVDDEEIVFANESYVGIHTAKDGKRTIKLRKPSKVTEVFENRCIGEDISVFVEDIPKHSTRLYKVL